MKTLVIASLFIFLTNISLGQELKKGNVVATHIMVLELKTGVTLEQFTDFLTNKYIPAYEKIWKGWKAYPVKRIRGENTDGFGMIVVIKSVKVRDKYFNKDGSYSEFGILATECLRPLYSDLTKLATIKSDKYTDWLVY
jgi:hypothetical protein